MESKQLKEATISLGYAHKENGDTVVSIELRDELARVTFAYVEIDPKQFTLLLSSLYSRPCKTTVNQLDKVGLKKEFGEQLVFEVPDNIYDTEKRNKIASKLAKENCPVGWEPSLYFGSQSSFFYKDGKKYARTSIFRWVEED